VPCEVLDVLRVRATREQNREAGIPEIVPVYIGQIGVPVKRFEVAVNYVLRVQGCTG
jgi:hypothetical protein